MDEPQPIKWMWSPDQDRYQEWPGEMSHPEVAKDIWQLPMEHFPNIWGGLHHPDGTTQIGWWPLTSGATENDAKKNAPLRLLEHLQKRIVNT